MFAAIPPLFGPNRFLPLRTIEDSSLETNAVTPARKEAIMSVAEDSARNPDSTFHVDQEALDSFSSQLRGACLTPSSPDYNNARVIWNGLADKRPAVIVQCIGAADVIDGSDLPESTGCWSPFVAAVTMLRETPPAMADWSSIFQA